MPVRWARLMAQSRMRPEQPVSTMPSEPAASMARSRSVTPRQRVREMSPVNSPTIGRPQPSRKRPSSQMSSALVAERKLGPPAKRGEASGAIR